MDEIRRASSSSKDFLEAMQELFDVDEESVVLWPTEEVAISLEPDWSEKWHNRTGPIETIKGRIPEVSYIGVKKLKRRV